MEEKITLEMLTQDGISIVRQQYTTINGIEYVIGQPNRTAYYNSEKGREILKAEVAEPYLTAILTMWGDTTTVADISE